MALSNQNMEALRKLNERRAVRVKEAEAIPTMTAERLKVACLENDGFETPELNDKLYLHFVGFRRIENLEPYKHLKALWLESNGIQTIEGLGHLSELRSLFLQQNLLTRIANLEGLVNLVTLDISNNSITLLEGLACLPCLTTLNAAKNALETAASVEHLKKCAALTNVNLDDNCLAGDQENTVITTLAGIPSLATLYLKGNPLIAVTRHYRKTVLSAIPGLQYLDDRPVFEVERVANEAWKSGGREAEVAAIKTFEAQQSQKAKDSMDKFREWQEDVRVKRAAELAAHNESRRNNGEPEVNELPRKSYVSYGSVSDRYAVEHLRMKRLIDKAEQVAKATGYHGTAMMDLGREMYDDEAALQHVLDSGTAASPGAGVSSHDPAKFRADLRSNYMPKASAPLVPSSESTDVSSSSHDEVEHAPLVATADASVTLTSAQEPPTVPKASPMVTDTPIDATLRSAACRHEADIVGESIRRFQQQLASENARGDTPTELPSIWSVPLDGALAKFAKQAAFDFEKVAKGLRAALLKGALRVPAESSVTQAEVHDGIDAEACRVRYTQLTAEKLTSPTRERAQLSTFQQLIAARYAAADDVDVPEHLLQPASDAVNRPIKPLEQLVKGEFRLDYFRQYVTPPVALPSMHETEHSRNAAEDSDEDMVASTRAAIRGKAVHEATGDAAQKEPDTLETDTEVDSEVPRPWTRAEILASLVGYAGITIPPSMLSGEAPPIGSGDEGLETLELATNVLELD